MTRVHARLRVGALFATLLVVACSDGPAAPLPGASPGTFRAVSSGAIVDTLAGVAILAVFPDGVVIPAYYSVQLYLTPGQSPFWLTIVGDGPRPSVGSYVVTPRTSPQTMPTVNAAKCVDNTVACFVEWGTRWETPADAGRLEITKSSSAGISGTLEVDLRTDAPAYVGQNLHVSARFDATCHPDVAPC